MSGKQSDEISCRMKFPDQKIDRHREKRKTTHRSAAPYKTLDCE